MPITAVGYDANGEAVDVPVDTRPAPPLPGMEPEDDADAEFFEGKRILGHKWSLSGNSMVSTRNAAMQDKLAVFKEGKSALLLVQVEPGSVTMEESTEDGHVRGVFHKRKLHITDVFVADDVDTEALFEQGLVRVRRADAEDDGIGFLTAEAPIPDDGPGDLAAALMEAGLCGKRHRGHLGTCRAAAHACELPEAVEGE
jgi:hypothetical protein